jgi:hypothetical protein
VFSVEGGNISFHIDLIWDSFLVLDKRTLNYKVNESTLNFKVDLEKKHPGGGRALPSWGK